jgi:hypothetical protein
MVTKVHNFHYSCIVDQGGVNNQTFAEGFVWLPTQFNNTGFVLVSCWMPCRLQGFTRQLENSLKMPIMVVNPKVDTGYQCFIPEIWDRLR